MKTVRFVVLLGIEVVLKTGDIIKSLYFKRRQWFDHATVCLWDDCSDTWFIWMCQIKLKWG
jgi:hypothetical protein